MTSVFSHRLPSEYSQIYPNDSHWTSLKAEIYLSFKYCFQEFSRGPLFWKIQHGLDQQGTQQERQSRSTILTRTAQQLHPTFDTWYSLCITPMPSKANLHCLHEQCKPLCLSDSELPTRLSASEARIHAEFMVLRVPRGWGSQPVLIHPQASCCPSCPHHQLHTGYV